MQEIMKAQQMSLNNQSGGRMKSVVTAVPKRKASRGECDAETLQESL